MRILGLLNQIRLLLEEQNTLLREVHLALTGRFPLASSRRPRDPIQPIGATRRRTAADVWQRQPETAESVAERDRVTRESAVASAVASDVTTPPTDESGSTDLPMTPIDGPLSAPLESRHD